MRIAVTTACIILAFSGPVMATPKLMAKGEIYGTVTNGTATYDDYSEPGSPRTQNLAGMNVKISFEINKVWDYYGAPDNQTFPVLLGTFTYDFTPPPFGWPWGFGQNYTWVAYNYIFSPGYEGFTNFTGTAFAGTVSMSAVSWGSQNEYGDLSINYSGGSPELKSMSGVGSVNYGYYWIETITLDADFDINGGWVEGVPEPATWAMMIAGFGLVGCMARRRPRELSARS